MVGALFQALLSGEERSVQRYQRIVSDLPTYEQKGVLFSLLRMLSTDRRQHTNPNFSGGTAALLLNIIGASESRIQVLCVWLIGASAAGLKESLEVQKAVCLIIASHPGSCLSRTFNYNC